MTNFSSVLYNGQAQTKILLNGVEVWSAGAEEPMGTYPYTVGVLSDIHIEGAFSQSLFTNAINYFNSIQPSMIISPGDLTTVATDEQFANYKAIRDTATMPFYEVTGNHEGASSRTYKSKITEPDCIAYHLYNLIERDFCYYLKGDKYYGWRVSMSADGTPVGTNVVTDSGVSIPSGDVYIFVSILGDANNSIFFNEQLQWLKDTLEVNRNKRCFVIEHCRAERLQYDATQAKYVDDLYSNYVSGNYGADYLKPLWGDASSSRNAKCFEGMMAHYTNCIWLHGHTHITPRTAAVCGVKPYFYDTHFGDAYDAKNLDASVNNQKYSYSIHIPSCAEPRGDMAIENSSEGCVMIVNQNSITMQYLDLTTNELLLEFTLATPRDTIPAGTFIDTSGTVK